MRWVVFIVLMAVLASGTVAFDIPPRNNVTITPECFNATSGALLGTSANLTVRNQSGIYYVVDSVTNLAPGVFQHNLTNLSTGQCYALDFACEDAGTWTNQYGTLCVQEEEDETMLAAIMLLPLILAIALALGGALLRADTHNALRVAAFSFSFLAFTVSMNMASVFVDRIYGWGDIAEQLARTSQVMWVVFGVFLLYLVVKAVQGAVEERKTKREAKDAR